MKYSMGTFKTAVLTVAALAVGYVMSGEPQQYRPAAAQAAPARLEAADSTQMKIVELETTIRRLSDEYMTRHRHLEGMAMATSQDVAELNLELAELEADFTKHERYAEPILSIVRPSLDGHHQRLNVLENLMTKYGVWSVSGALEREKDLQRRERALERRR